MGEGGGYKSGAKQNKICKSLLSNTVSQKSLRNNRDQAKITTFFISTISFLREKAQF